MLGWEFPPFFAGGAGIVCNELTRALNRTGADVTFIMPSGPEEIYENLNIDEPGKPRFRILIANNIFPGRPTKVYKVNSLLQAYTTSEQYQETYNRHMQKRKGKHGALYGKNLKEEVMRFAEKAKEIALMEDFDVIHAHDWTTFLAGIEIKKATGKPLVVQVHITEFDKTGGDHADPFIYGIEKQGMDEADRIITVSNKLKETCINKYFADPAKIRVVHNAATTMNSKEDFDGAHIKAGDKVVLFAGRVTLQKGPDYFVYAAKKVLEEAPNTKFVIAGNGDMLTQVINLVADLGLSKNFIFTGFYTREEGEKLFSMADVFVMPSVSEPFGLVPYEAQIKRTPTIISKQSGISEVLRHALKVDFWDVDEMAHKILALLHYSSLHNELKHNGYEEAKSATWDIPASKCLNIYNEIIGRGEI